MSGWTIITMRAKESKDYKYSEYDGPDPYDAFTDICATVDEDSRESMWTEWHPYVYVYLNAPRYAFGYAEEFLEDYDEMVDDAVVLGANDTTDQGTARYYHRPDLGMWSDQYEETEHGYVGEMALSVINARHGIVARDPFHNMSTAHVEYRDESRRTSSGTNRL